MTEWSELPLTEIARISRGTEPGSASYTDSSHGTRFLRVGDITGKTDKPIYTDSRQIVLISESDVVLTLDGSPGYVGTGYSGAISSGIRKVEVINPDEVSLSWLRYCLQSQPVQETIRRHTQGVTILHASSSLPHIRIPIPPLYDQERIVQILDDADSLKRLQTQAMFRLSLAIPSTFNKMFGYPHKNINIVKLGDIAKLERGRFSPRPRNDPSYFDGDYPFIQTGDISDSGGLLSNYKQTLNERGKKVSKEFPAGTIVIAIVGATIGATAILQIPVYCTDSIVGITVNPKYCYVEFVEFFLRSIRPSLLAQAPDAARANLNLEILKNISIPLSSLEQQSLFVEYCNNIRKLQALQTTNHNRIEVLFQSLLYRAFRGDL